jgi:hypothetical protein
LDARQLQIANRALAKMVQALVDEGASGLGDITTILAGIAGSFGSSAGVPLDEIVKEVQEGYEQMTQTTRDKD